MPLEGTYPCLGWWISLATLPYSLGFCGALHDWLSGLSTFLLCEDISEECHHLLWDPEVVPWLMHSLPFSGSPVCIRSALCSPVPLLVLGASGKVWQVDVGMVLCEK